MANVTRVLVAYCFTPRPGHRTSSASPEIVWRVYIRCIHMWLCRDALSEKWVKDGMVVRPQLNTESRTSHSVRHVGMCWRATQKYAFNLPSFCILFIRLPQAIVRMLYVDYCRMMVMRMLSVVCKCIHHKGQDSFQYCLKHTWTHACETHCVVCKYSLTSCLCPVATITTYTEQDSITAHIAAVISNKPKP